MFRRRTVTRLILSVVLMLCLIQWHHQISVVEPRLQAILDYPVQHSESDERDFSLNTRSNTPPNTFLESLDAPSSSKRIPSLAETAQQRHNRQNNNRRSRRFHDEKETYYSSHQDSSISDLQLLQSDTTTSSDRMRGKFLLLGDSITQLSFSASLSGWGAHLADVYQRRVDVYNRGFSGYNTDWFLKYAQTPEGKLDLFLDQHNSHTNSSPNRDHAVKLITIFFGANDASDASLNPRHHVPLHRFEQNLKAIVNLCRESFGQHVRIILITPPPVHSESRIQYQIQRYGADKATGKLERTLELSGLYADVVCKVAQEFQIPCLNLWKEMQESSSSSLARSTPTSESRQVQGISDTPDEMSQPQPSLLWSRYLSDGLHLSQLGNIFLAQRLVTLIEQVYPEIAIQPCSLTGYTANSASTSGNALTSVGPWHDHIDHENVDVAFHL